MARISRKKSESGIYHIVLRGINKQIVFYDDEDKEVFLSRIKLAKEKYDFEVYAYCFMSNHVHLLFKEKETPLGTIMRVILSSYVFWYNSKYERIGNLFQDRYKSEPIDAESHFLCAVRYIHQNPVKAQLVEKAADFKWSSYKAYLSEKKSLIRTDLALSMLQGRKSYIKFMEEIEYGEFLEPTENFKISDDKLIKEILKLLKMKEIKEIYLLNRLELNETIKKILTLKGSNPYQVSRVTGVTMRVIRTILA